MSKKYDKTFYGRCKAKPKKNSRKNPVSLERKLHKLAAAFHDPALSLKRGYDPELLYVECARCGAPVIWEKGRTTAILKAAGIDPLELDPYCLLLTDVCPKCAPDKKMRAKLMYIGPAGSSQGGNA